MRSILQLYKAAYGGLSTASWMLALVILINRAGSMVLPFLSVYLTEALGFGLQESGKILSMYGLGSIVGGLSGGWLTDRVGHFKVQFSSLVISGLGFIGIAFLEGFYSLMVGVFLISMIAESLRPANASSIAYYAKPENLTRAFSLNRMAVNLGFSIGPALGGILAAISFKFLFFADGITCLLAGFIFFIYFYKKPGRTRTQRVENQQPTSVKGPFQDRLYLVFALFVCLYACLFFQLFMTLPLYYRQVYGLSESSIGLMLALNGAIVFLVEMILVYKIGNRYRLQWLIAFGALLVGVSFVFLLIYHAIFMLIIAMIILSMSEILAMPYMATLAVERSVEANRGAYLGIYTVSYSAAFVIAPLGGTWIIDHYGFNTLWAVIIVLSIMLALGLYHIVIALGKPFVGIE
jgi:MFS family permease